MNVSVLGWYGHGNIGDEAFKLAFPLLLPGDAVSCVESLRPDDPSDAYVLGGGDVVYEAYTGFLKQFPTKPKIAASVTITPNSDLADLGLFDHVYVRDQMSMDVAKAHMDEAKLSYMPDATCVLQPDAVAGREWLTEAFNAAGLELYEKVVVCVVSTYATFNRRDTSSRDFIKFLGVADELSLAADTHNASFVFLPFSTKPPNDDSMGNSFVGGRCKFYQKNYVVYQHLSVQATLNIIACAQAVISTRLHSTIFATISGVPFIDLTHHDKNLGFIQTLGKPEWSIPLWQFSPQAFNDLLGQFVGGRVPDPDLVSFTDKSRAQLEALELFPHQPQA